MSSNSEIDFNDLDELKYSYITLKIGEGTNSVYSSTYNNFNKAPKFVYINEIKQSTIKINYTFNESENSVILIWEKPVYTCREMFMKCDKIIEILILIHLKLIICLPCSMDVLI